MASIDIKVAVIPKGPSSNDGVNFTFPYPNPYVDAQGNITVPANEQPVLQFHVVPAPPVPPDGPPTISWKNPPCVGTFDVSFLLGAGTTGEDALWIWDATQPKPTSNQHPAMFSGPAMGPNSKMLATTDANTAPADYNYCLKVGVAIVGQKPLVFTLDPRIINRGRNFNRPIFLIVVGVLLVVAAFIAVRAL
ncbi:MAG: hypothetical protein ACHP7D_11215 [Lysobacterales bacterium]